MTFSNQYIKNGKVDIGEIEIAIADIEMENGTLIFIGTNALSMILNELEDLRAETSKTKEVEEDFKKD